MVERVSDARPADFFTADAGRAPVNEHAEARFAPPAEARIPLGWRLRIGQARRVIGPAIRSQECDLPYDQK